jgi:hypothetical protein
VVPVDPEKLGPDLGSHLFPNSDEASLDLPFGNSVPPGEVMVRRGLFDEIVFLVDPKGGGIAGAFPDPLEGVSDDLVSPGAVEDLLGCCRVRVGENVREFRKHAFQGEQTGPAPSLQSALGLFPAGDELSQDEFEVAAESALSRIEGSQRIGFEEPKKETLGKILRFFVRLGPGAAGVKIDRLPVSMAEGFEPVSIGGLISPDPLRETRRGIGQVPS